MTTFSATVENWCKDTKDGIDYVRKESTKRLAEELNTPRDAGGNLPRTSGFLWASFDAELGRLPTMLSAPPEGASFTYDPAPVNAVIDASKLDGPAVHLAWRAEYARRQNYGYTGRAGYLFLELGMQRWPQIVEQVEAERFSKAA